MANSKIIFFRKLLKTLKMVLKRSDSINLVQMMYLILSFNHLVPSYVITLSKLVTITAKVKDHEKNFCALIRLPHTAGIFWISILKLNRDYIFRPLKIDTMIIIYGTQVT